MCRRLRRPTGKTDGRHAARMAEAKPGGADNGLLIQLVSNSKIESESNCTLSSDDGGRLGDR